MLTPYQLLFHQPPDYSHLRVFGCLCYPNVLPTTPHKLAPRSCRCVFLGYSAEHKGYRCLDLATNKVIISRHVTFDEHQFPFTVRQATPASAAIDHSRSVWDLLPAPPPATLAAPSAQDLPPASALSPHSPAAHATASSPDPTPRHQHSTKHLSRLHPHGPRHLRPHLRACFPATCTPPSPHNIICRLEQRGELWCLNATSIYLPLFLPLLFHTHIAKHSKIQIGTML